MQPPEPGTSDPRRRLGPSGWELGATLSDDAARGALIGGIESRRQLFQLVDFDRGDWCQLDNGNRRDFELTGRQIADRDAAITGTPATTLHGPR